ncbi:hypothetical protein Tsp_03821 [Trichinella spiralis]|uniref:hypothetical protein n=1 Tax=Trichinella spiralis TaxID=6334 RepID=UPI0001EFC0F6|nr:hypothetical protein Tsp_03821 [Trichinella spiralis]
MTFYRDAFRFSFLTCCLASSILALHVKHARQLLLPSLFTLANECSRRFGSGFRRSLFSKWPISVRDLDTLGRTFKHTRTQVHTHTHTVAQSVHSFSHTHIQQAHYSNCTCSKQAAKSDELKKKRLKKVLHPPGIIEISSLCYCTASDNGKEEEMKKKTNNACCESEIGKLVHHPQWTDIP